MTTQNGRMALPELPTHFIINPEWLVDNPETGYKAEVQLSNGLTIDNFVRVKIDTLANEVEPWSILTIRLYKGAAADLVEKISDISKSNVEPYAVYEYEVQPEDKEFVQVGDKLLPKTLVILMPAPGEGQKVSATVQAVDIAAQQTYETFVGSLIYGNAKVLPADVTIGNGDKVLDASDVIGEGVHQGKVPVEVFVNKQEEGSTVGGKEGDLVRLAVTVKDSEGNETTKVFLHNLTAEDVAKDKPSAVFYVDLPQGKGDVLKATAQLLDSHGNRSPSVSKEAEVPTVTKMPEVEITLNDITADNVVNAAESKGYVRVTGKATGDVKAGDNVIISLSENAKFTRKVDANGNFSLVLKGEDLAKDADKTISATITVKNEAGSSKTATAHKEFGVDTTGPKLGITLNDITKDNIINAAEEKGNVTISGQVSGEFKAGDKVVVAIDDQTKFTRSVNAEGKFSLVVPASKLVADADKTIKATVTSRDEAGNVGTAETAKAYAVDTVAPQLSIALNHITADNIINAAEAKGNVTVTGKVSGEFKAGDKVVISLDDKVKYTTAVDANGNFSKDIPASRLVADADKAIKAVVTSKDAAGNIGTAETAKEYAVDTVGPKLSIALNNITADNIINAAEAKGNVTVSGKVGGEFKVGDKVVIKLDDNTTYTRAVNKDGNFSASVPASKLLNDADKKLTATVTSKDEAGNVSTATATKAYAVDTVAPKLAITLDDVTADNIVNIAESNGNITLTGKVSGEYKAGDKVVVSLDPQTVYTTKADANGNFSVVVPASKLVADADKAIKAVVTSKDAAGNVGTAETAKSYDVDVVAPSAPTTTIALNNITADNIVNWDESKGNVTVSGKVTGEFNAGDKVVIALDPKTTYTTTVDAQGNFSAVVAGSKLVADADKTLKATLTTTDVAGNTGTIEATKAYGVEAKGVDLNLRALDGDLTMYYGLSRWEYNRGGAGDTVARGDSKDPFLTTDANDRVIIGGMGREQQGGGSTSNFADTGAAARLTDGSASITTVDMGKGDDFLHVRGDQQQATRVYLGEGDDVYNLGRKLTAAKAGDLTSAAIFGEAGNDTISVGGSIHNSWIYGGSGSDTINIGYGPVGGGSLVGNTVIDLGSGRVMPGAYKSVYADGSARSLGNDNNKDSATDVNKLNIKTNVDPAGEIYGGAGKDLVKVEGFFNGKMDLGSNDDVLTANRIGFNAGKVDGGEGNDTVILTGKDNLLSLSQFVRVETIDLTGAGKNTLRITGENAKNTGVKGVFVKGNGDDVVDFGIVSPGKAIMHEGRKGSWSKSGSIMKDGVMYEGYSFSGNNMDDATIYVQHGIQVV